MSRWSKLFLLALFASPLPLSAQAAGARSHEGFFLRFLAGGGPGSVTMDDVGGEELTFSSSVTGSFHFQIGGAVRDNLVLFADLGGFSMTEPDVEWGGATESGAGVTVVLSGLGAGASYYFMPANLYVSGSVLASIHSIDFEGSEGETDFGPSVLAVIGKEWWVGDKWGLGVALTAELASTPDQADDSGARAQVVGSQFGVVFSATLN